MIDHLLLCLTLTAGVQGPPPPPPPPMPAPRDPATVKKGTAVIKGHVLTAEGRPLRRAQIRVAGDDPRDALSTTSGLEGEYELRELPAGRYTVQATRVGYLRAQYGQREYGEPGIPIEVANGATVEKIDLTMMRAGVVSGRVTDETGDVLAGVDIRAMQMQFYLGRKRIVPVSTAPVHVNTDDMGYYRLTGLPPGEYFIAGRLRDTWMSDEKDPRMLSYAPTYFPGTADVAEARRVKVASGQEVAGIDFALVAEPAASLSGTALASDGAPLAGARLLLSQEIMGPAGGSMSTAGNALTDANGVWTIRDVSPGEYIIRVTGSAGDRPTESAALPVTVHGADIEGLVVATDAGAVISGRLVTESGEPLPSSGSRPTVTTTPVSMMTGTVRPSAGNDDGVVASDGTFSRRSVSGPVVIRVTGLPRSWGLKSVDVGGRDHAGLPIDLPPSQTLANVTVVVTNQLGSLRGRVTDREGRPATGTVLLFPVDPSRWLEAAGNQRTARPDRAGAYAFDTLRPGDYFAIALDAMEGWQMNDPDFLVQQKERSMKITIGAEAATLDLQVVRR
jgi:hypothetical protein